MDWSFVFVIFKQNVMVISINTKGDTPRTDYLHKINAHNKFDKSMLCNCNQTKSRKCTDPITHPSLVVIVKIRLTLRNQVVFKYRTDS